MGPRSAPRGPLSRFHDRLGVWVAILVLLTVIPLASARAPIWLIWTGLLALVSAYVVLRGASLERRWKPRFTQEWLVALLLLVVPLWASIQLLSPTLISTRLRELYLPAEASLSGILRFVGYLLLAAVLLEVVTRRSRVLLLARILFFGIAAQAVWAMVALQMLGDVSLWGEKTAYLGYATGTFVNRNSLATYLGFGLVLGFGLLAERGFDGQIRATRRTSLFDRLDLEAVIISGGCLFMLIALIETQSRLGILSSALGVAATLLLIRVRRGLPLRRILIETGFVFGTLLMLMLLLGAGGVSDRLLFTGVDSNTRLSIYSQTIDMISQRPWTGYGMDAFGPAFEAFRAPPLTDPVTYDLAHNTYLALWSELGLIAGSAPILAVAILLVKLLYRKDAEKGYPGLSAAAVGAVTLAAVHSLGDFSLEIPANAYMFVAILCLGLGRPRQTSSAAPRSAPRSAGPKPKIQLHEGEAG